MRGGCALLKEWGENITPEFQVGRSAMVSHHLSCSTEIFWPHQSNNWKLRKLIEVYDFHVPDVADDGPINACPILRSLHSERGWVRDLEESLQLVEHYQSAPGEMLNSHPLDKNGHLSDQRNNWNNQINLNCTVHSSQATGTNTGSTAGKSLSHSVK